MQEYIIKSFKRISDNIIFERQETGSNSGGYVAQGSPSYGPSVKRLNDFLCDGSFAIHAINRQVVNNVATNIITFTVGDRLSCNDGTHIKYIRIINSTVILVLLGGTTAYPTILLANAVKYVEPTSTSVTTTQPTRRGVERPRKDIFTELTTTIEGNYRGSEIRLEKTLIKSMAKLTLQQFLVRFFTELNNERNTIFIESREVQTETRKRRSLGDIYMICKYYYPNITLKELLQLLYVDLITLPGYRSSFCTQIRKRVWYYSVSADNVLVNTTHPDEYGNIVEFYINGLEA